MADTFCTTVIATVGRPTLARAVRSVLDQHFEAARIEVVVVNDSGRPLPPEPWQDDPRVRVLQTDRQERCVARNTGAAAANGRYLHFLDDDDVLLPGAMQALWLRAAEAHDAAWIYGGWQAADNDGRVLDEFLPDLTGNLLAPLVGGESIPLQASLVARGPFDATGGFDPRLCGVEDRDLGRRLALVGEVAGARAVVARIRAGEVGSTTDWHRLPEADRLGREKLLDMDGAAGRLRDSALSDHSGGRVARAYLASAAWNLRHRRLGVALRRTRTALTFAWQRLGRRQFWNGLGTRNP